MIFGKIKDKLTRHDDDLGDIRSRILSEERPDKDYNQRFERRLGEDRPESREMLDPAVRPFDPRDDIAGMALERTPVSIDEKPATNSYEVLDKLNLIESQLSAIRSQTELLNERMKNLETKLGYGRRW